MTYREYDYREIITKAVCGKGRNYIKEINECQAEHKPSSILGCWIINHQYKAEKYEANTIVIKGSYDIHVWYSYDQHAKTEVVSEQIHYVDQVPLKERDKQCLDRQYEVMAKVLKQPNCLKCEIAEDGRGIIVEVEREFVVNMIGETKVKVKVEPISSTSYKND